MAERVLIADDDKTSRDILRRALLQFGHEVVIVEEGNAAWEVLDAADGPSMAILDWMMPGLDGPEICRRVRNRLPPERGYIYILLLTGRDKPGDIIEGLEAGADDYITKPCSLAELHARVKVGWRIVNLESKLRAERAHYEHQARHDSLTGMWTRAVVIDHLTRELSRVRRNPGCLGVLLVDVDHFKRVNDTYGHLVGDEVLALVAQQLRASMRVYDGIGRYGGEEFLVVADCRSEEEARGVAERIRSALGDDPLQTSAGSLAITASVGLATSSTQGWDVSALLRAADTALYAAKHAGRNCVSVAPVAVESA